MIVKSLNDAAGKVTFSIDNVLVDYISITEYSLELSANKHDLLTVVIQGIPPRALTDYLGAAVSFNINSGPGRTNTFYGYVVFTEPMHHNRDGLINGSPIQLSRVYCMGASYLFKELNSKVWELPTLGNVLNYFSDKYRFSVDYPKDTYKPTRLVQANESDWMFLDRTISQLGYSFSVHGTHIHVWDNYKAAGRVASYHIASVAGKTVGNRPFSILDFEAQLGRVSASGDSSKSIISLVDSLGVVHTVTDTNAAYTPGSEGSAFSNLFKKPIYDTVLTIEEATRRTQGSDKARAIYNAKLKVFAGAGAVPGGVVDIQKFDSEFDGLWYIQDVRHDIKSQNYTTELTLKKYSNGSNELPTITVEEQLEPPQPVLLEDKWVAETVRVLEYA
jgi:hypothetical protein